MLLPPSLSHELFERRTEEEKRARREAESLLETRARELFEANESLQRMSDTLAARIQELEAERARVLHIGRTDALTGLLNRGAFLSGLTEKMAASARFGSTVALFIIDLDRFKEINDSQGHEAGDMLLQEIGLRLSDAARAGDLIARLGGDEFAIVAEMAPGDDPAPLAGRLLRALARPMELKGRTIQPSGSIGVALHPEQAADASDLQRFADMALYRAKAAGRNRWSIFDQALRDAAEQRHAEEADLRRAIDEGEIVPWFQPVVDAASGEVVSLEVLARWNHRHGLKIGPDKFIRMAEELGLVSRIDAAIFDQACAIARPWIGEGLVGSIACNVSPRELVERDFADALIKRINASGFPSQALVVEITESFLLQDLDLARRHMERLAAYGVSIALDDFGIGYSNLRALMQLPIDTVKIDRSLTSDIADPRVAALIRLLAQSTRGLGMSMIAEGIEDEAQAIHLRAVGCDRMQGYWFARPMPAAEVETFLRQKREIRIPAPEQDLALNVA